MNAIDGMFHSFREFLAPHHCEACGKYTGNSLQRLEFLCNECMNSLIAPPTEDELFQRLLRHFPQDDLSVLHFFSLMSVPHSSPLLDMIYSLKYRGMSRIGLELGRELGETMQHVNYLDFELILPIPIHSARARERGYNQASVIAKGVSESVKIPVVENAIIRNTYTRTQTQMNAVARKDNVSGVFTAGKDADLIKGKSLLLVDDVLTTGSTINSCATSLLEIGARQVNVATLAVAE